jgi:hypothetical protein
VTRTPKSLAPSSSLGRGRRGLRRPVASAGALARAGHSGCESVSMSLPVTWHGRSGPGPGHESWPGPPGQRGSAAAGLRRLSGRLPVAARMHVAACPRQALSDRVFLPVAAQCLSSCGETPRPESGRAAPAPRRSPSESPPRPPPGGGRVRVGYRAQALSRTRSPALRCSSGFLVGYECMVRNNSMVKSYHKFMVFISYIEFTVLEYEFIPL